MALSRARGFTLIEVLVALTVLAVALGALVKAGSGHAANAAYLRDKVFAHWVAVNAITELQLEADWPAPGERSGNAELGGREWRWRGRVEETFDADVRRVTVSVGDAGGRRDASLVTRVGFLPRLAPGAGP
jgi:general secretion pathway protein I